jgi:hypothetical protein
MRMLAILPGGSGWAVESGWEDGVHPPAAVCCRARGELPAAGGDAVAHASQAVAAARLLKP